MGFELKQQLQLKLTQQLVMTPQLQQAIKLLQLSMLELTQTVEQELEENPVLEVAETAPEPEEETSPEEVSQAELVEMGAEVANKAVDVDLESGSSISEIDWNDYANEYETAPAAVPKESVHTVSGGPDQRTKKPNLQAHLHWQLSFSDVTPEEEEVGQYIIGNLNMDGFLEVDEENIIFETGCDPDTARRMISRIREMDPPGIGAVNVQDSLALQLDRLGLGDSLASVIVKEYLTRLETKNYAAIARATRQPVEAVLAAVRVIMGLSPYPGRPYNDEEPHYILPDVYVYKVDDEYVIMLNDDGLPQLRVNPFYRDLLRNKTKTPEATREYVQSKMKSAVWLIKSIQQRQRTIYRVVESLVKFQKEFFEKGVAHLVPLVLRDVAEDLGMHESTISRVTTNKFVHTPQGIFELKYFFKSSIKRDDGGAVSSESVKQRIRKFIRTENPEKPYSDQAIVDILEGEDVRLARRTVAKYREHMGILPSKYRKQPKLT